MSDETTRARLLEWRVCNWRSTSDSAYLTACGQSVEFTEAGPQEGAFQFCPYCGAHLAFQSRRTAGQQERVQ